MSWWTDFRDTLQSIATVVVNYYYPGSGFLVNKLHSKGSQEQMATGWGQAAMLGSGGFGAFEGNLGNYASTFSALSGGGGESAAALESAGWGSGSAGAGAEAGYSGGFVGGAAGTDPQAMQYAQSLIDSGMPESQAYAEAGITPGGANVAATGSGAAPSFTGQQMAGATGSGTPPLNAGTGNYFGGYPSAAAQDAAMASKLGTAKAAGAMPWGSPANLMSIGSGLYGLSQAGQMMNASKQAQEQADPFGPYRKQYADMMSEVSRDPSQLQKLPGYQAGLQAVQRSMAAQGYTGSGNMMSALSKYGGDFYNNAMNMYGGLAGAQFNPASAAQLGLQGRQYGIELAGRSLGSLGYGAQMAGNQWPRYGG